MKLILQLILILILVRAEADDAGTGGHSMIELLLEVELFVCSVLVDR